MTKIFTGVQNATLNLELDREAIVFFVLYLEMKNKLRIKLDFVSIKSHVQSYYGILDLEMFEIRNNRII